ncbi:MAG: NifU family protein [Planctomycetota bacterium]
MTDSDPHAIARELDWHIQQLQQLCDAKVRDLALEALQLVDRLHRPGIQALAAGLRAVGQFDAACADERIALLFELYAAASDRELVVDALESVRPYVESHGGGIELVDVNAGVVTLRLNGACQGCAGSRATLQQGIETALREGYPGFREIVVAEPGATSQQPPSFIAVAARADLPDDQPIEVRCGEQSLVVVRRGDEVHAFAPACPSCGHPLRTAKVSATVIVCAGVNCAFDLRTGRRVDGVVGPGLRAIPATWQGDDLLVADSVDPHSLFSTP